MASRLVRGVISGAVLALASCSAPPLEVSFGDCSDVLAPPASPTCVLAPEERSLRLWVKTDPDARVTLGSGAVLVGEPKPVAEGSRWYLEVEPATSEIVLHARWREPWRGLSRRWVLPVLRQQLLPRVDEGNLDDPGSGGQVARQRLRRRLEDELELGSSLFDRGPLLKRLAELESGVDADRALQRFSEAASHLRREGRTRSLIHALTRQHHLLYSTLADNVGAQAALDALPEISPGDSRSAVIAAIYRSSWNLRLGRFGTARRELLAAEAKAERLGDPWLVFLKQTHVLLASRLGLFEEARETQNWLRKEAHEGMQVCQRARIMNDLGWSQLVMLEGGTVANPREDLLSALALAQACGESLRSNILVNLALAHLHEGNGQEAQSALDQARLEAPSPQPWLADWLRVVEGRIALTEGRAPEALEQFEALQAAAEQSLLLGAQWRAAVGQGRALDSMGRVSQALARFEAAEDLLDSGGMEAPFAAVAGPESEWVFFQRGTRLYLDLLLRSGRFQEAMAVARRSRRRSLTHLVAGVRREALAGPAKEAWDRYQERFGKVRARVEALARQEREEAVSGVAKITAERAELLAEQEDIVTGVLELLAPRLVPPQLEPPRLAAPSERTLLHSGAPGEVILLYHPLPKGWVGFAIHEERIHAERIELEDVAAMSPRDLSLALLVPFSRLILPAERIRVLPFGELWKTDFHALPFRGEALLERGPVSYGLDLGEGSISSRVSPAPGIVSPNGVFQDGVFQDSAFPDGGKRALLVEDPSKSLLHAPEEVRRLREVLSRRNGWRVETLAGREARAEVVRHAWSQHRFDLFHFAGHSDLEGNSRLEAGLVFGGSSRLTLGDLLAQRRSPRMVVLSACSAAKASEGRAPVSLGLAQGFLLAGAHLVVGPNRSVADSTSAALMEQFYDLWPALSPEESLRQAQLTLMKQDPARDWASFRVIRVR